jgi:hypothetical protein
MLELAEQLRDLVDSAAPAVTLDELRDREPNDIVRSPARAGVPARRRSIRLVAAALVVLGVVVGGAVTAMTKTRTGTLHSLHHGFRSHAISWQLTASLSGTQYQLGSGNPGSISQVNCGGGTTCFLSTFYGVGGDSALSGSTYVSHDSGVTWQPVTLPAGVAIATPVSCVSATWCAAGGGLLDPTTGDPAAKKEMRDPELLVTTNGGATWTMRAVPVPPDVQQLPAYGSLPAETTYWPAIVDAVDCTAVNVCNMVAHVLNDGAQTSGLIPDTLVFLRTTDGGTTWSQTDLPERPSEAGYETRVSDGNQQSLACPSASTCVDVSTLGGFTGGVVDAWRSTDGGASWQETQVPGIDSALPGLSCPDQNDCWMSIGTTALRSTDGGVTWSSVQLPSETDEEGLFGPEWQSISCISASTCVIGGPTIETTSDGGVSWVPATLPPGVGAVQSVSCHAAGSCIALATPTEPPGSHFLPNGSSLVLTSRPAETG